MTRTVISVEHLSKQYDLGVIGTGTLSRDLNRWWARLRKQPDPYTRIGQKDHFERLGESILALDDISFSVGEGEALGIIGRNGAGKSTLLKILSRVTAPTRGVVKVKGRIGSLLEVGTGFHPELTGRENVYLNGAILGMKKAEVTRKFDEIVSFAGVEKFIDTPVKRYSSGMYVRLAFAVAAHLDPDILIVDEVLAVGDAEFQKKCLGKMGDVASEGRTVLFVSHNIAAVETLCKRGILLQDGRIRITGLIEDVTSSYLNENYLSNYSNFDESNQSAKILCVYFLDEQGQVTESFMQGQTIGMFIQYSNPSHEELQVDVSFFTNHRYKLWNFEQNESKIENLSSYPDGEIIIRFFPPILNATEIQVHVGLRKASEPKGFYVDLVQDALSFFIKESGQETYQHSDTLVNIPFEFSVKK